MLLKNCIIKTILLGLTLFILSGCGYRINNQNFLDKYSTISVPYIKNDPEGEFTSVLVHKLASSGNWRYLTDGGELILEVEVLDTKHEHVGFRYYRDANGNLRDQIVPSEDRVSILTKVQVIERSSGKVVMGPTHIFSSIDTDFDPMIDEDNLIRFSMGQLDFIGTARQIAHQPLFVSLSEKIVDYISSYW